MKISDYIVSRLVSQKVEYVFGVQGSGTCVQLFDALHRAAGIEGVSCLHEQAAGMAADACAQLTGTVGVCIATAGPGASNLTTCVAGSFYNSVPLLCIIGQPSVSQQGRRIGLRHYGFHENDVRGMFGSIAKYVVEIDDPADAAYEVDKALYIAQEGRPGPAVVSIPDDITWLQYDPSTQREFVPPAASSMQLPIEPLLESMQAAKRPILMFGSGVRRAGAVEEARELAGCLGWPVALTWSMRDTLPDDDPLNIGSFGSQGGRAGNFAVQCADFVLAVGARLDPFETGVPSRFAPHASVVSVDVDRCELEKYSALGIHCDHVINVEAGVFIASLLSALKNCPKVRDYSAWKARIAMWRARYPTVGIDELKSGPVNPYALVGALSDLLQEGDTIVADSGSNKNYLFQAFRFKSRQRLFTWTNYACLGYALPAGIGACLASHRRVVAVMGDGALQFNIQELATAVFHELDLKLIILDNGGYSTIMHSQDGYLEGRHVASCRSGGLPIPELEPILRAYGWPVVTVTRNDDIRDTLPALLDAAGPAACIVKLSWEHKTVPARKGADPLEDMTPRLPREELAALMSEGQA